MRGMEADRSRALPSVVPARLARLRARCEGSARLHRLLTGACGLVATLFHVVSPGSAIAALPQDSVARLSDALTYEIARCEKPWQSTRAGRFSGYRRFAPRRTNMSPREVFVKRVNTTYCAFVLGRTQDVAQTSCIRSGAGIK